MRKFVPQAVLLMVCLYATETKAGFTSVFDTTKNVHAIDGNTSEWKADQFTTDKETGITYAVDHDARYFYVAVKVADQKTQLKLMRQGMNLYIDKKGRRREATGIEFPVKHGQVFSLPPGDNSPQTMPDFKVMRESLASNLALLRVFGFEEQEDNLQPIVKEGGVNVSFDWDAADAMVIEYLVPVNFIGKTADLNGKQISFGWKLNGINLEEMMRNSSPAVVSTQMAGVPANSGPPRTATPSRSISMPQRNPNSNDPRFRDQYLWTKYTVTF